MAFADDNFLACCGCRMQFAWMLLLRIPIWDRHPYTTETAQLQPRQWVKHSKDIHSKNPKALTIVAYKTCMCSSQVCKGSLWPPYEEAKGQNLHPPSKRKKHPTHANQFTPSQGILEKFQDFSINLCVSCISFSRFNWNKSIFKNLRLRRAVYDFQNCNSDFWGMLGISSSI